MLRAVSGRGGVTELRSRASGRLRACVCVGVTHVLWQVSCAALRYVQCGDGVLWLWGLTGRRWMQHVGGRQGRRYAAINAQNNWLVSA